MSDPKGKTDFGIVSPLFTINETAGYTRSSRSTIYVRLNEFETVKLGKRLFITRRSADNYIERNASPARGKPTEPPKRTRRKALTASAP